MDDNYGHFNLGLHTLDVPLSLHSETRQKLLNNLRASLLKSDIPSPFVVVQGGKSEYRHDTDHEILFRQESYFQYLFGVKEPDCFGAIDLEKGTSILFVPKLPPEYAIWMGAIKDNNHWKRVYEVDECHYTGEIETILKAKGCQTILVLHGKNTDSGSIHSGATFPGIENFKVDTEHLFPVLQECRVTKTPKEIDIMRYICRASAEAHCEIMKSVKPGMMEYEMESLFQHYLYSRCGCRKLSYTCICGSGSNSSVLHYGHAGAPNARLIKDGDILMFDMGGEYHCWGADISRSFPANRKFTQDQREVYSAVLAAQQAVMDAMKPGVSWPEMHILSNRVICEQLKKYNFLHGDIDEMMANHVGTLFMPHGLGHLLGLDTHDVGGYVGGMERSKEPGLKYLRLGRNLLENMVITVEPGIYFIRAVLLPAFENPALNKFLNVEKISKFLDFGGIRIEDDVLVLKDGIENLSAACPRSIEDIEALMMGKQ